MCFDPYNCSLKIRKSIKTLTPQSGSSLGNVKVHFFTFSYTLGTMRCDSQVSFLAYTLPNPYFGREPEAKVAINIMGPRS
jgi:hypothetical protein